VKDSKKNTKVNEENDEKAPVSGRRRSQETRQEDVKVMGVAIDGWKGWRMLHKLKLPCSEPSKDESTVVYKNEVIIFAQVVVSVW